MINALQVYFIDMEKVQPFLIPLSLEGKGLSIFDVYYKVVVKMDSLNPIPRRITLYDKDREVVPFTLSEKLVDYIDRLEQSIKDGLTILRINAKCTLLHEVINSRSEVSKMSDTE